MKLRVMTLALVTAAMAANTPASVDLDQALLPPPRTMHTGTESLVLTSQTTLSMNTTNVVGLHLAERLRKGTGWPLPIADKGTIRLEFKAGSASPEAYSLDVTTNAVIIRAGTPAGIARGAESLLQLMPPSVYGSNRCDTVTLPVVTITDSPQFAWRGLHIDVSRKFQDKDTILKFLDGIAACKLSVFHWHLTDDQGWRLPIEGYPKLTEKGPAYSRADIREVVAHAAELGITILPEVDMPGHSGDSCRAYPDIRIRNDKGQPTGTMNPGADASYAFIEAVMKDVAAQFPNSPYVHIGADEVVSGGWKKDAQCQAFMQHEKLKSPHELYIHFINRAVSIAKLHGLKTIAWDEALDPRNDPALIIMSWRGMPPGIRATELGRQVIFTPTPELYFDHANSRSIQNRHAYSSHPAYLNTAYFFNPGLPAVVPANRSLVMGGQACIWGECIRDAQHPFIMAFPRACALAETLWVPRDRLDWPGFVKRLEIQRQRFAAMKIPYFWEPESLAVNIGAWKPGDIAAKKGVMEFSLDGLLRHAGEQEFLVGQGSGDGQFRIDAVELLKDGVVVDQDRHPYESSVYKDTRCIYLVKNPDVTGHYSVRIHVKQLFGESAATVQLIPALAPDKYSQQCRPGSGANRSKQTPP